MREWATKIESKILNNATEAVEYEWLDTNGLGGYAMGTPILANTRKYHSLLACTPGGLKERHTFLSKVDIDIQIDGVVYELGTNIFPGAIHPSGYASASSFELELVPRTSFEVEGARVAISVAMIRGMNAVALEIASEGVQSIWIRPFLAFREIHSLCRENGYAKLAPIERPGGIRFRPYDGLPPLDLLVSSRFDLEGEPCWYRDFEYPAEEARGYEYHEDLIAPGTIHLSATDTIYLVATIDPGIDDPERRYHDELERRLREIDGIEARFAGDAEAMSFAVGARHFLIGPERSSSPSVIAGFPWFGEWGRDTMISLDGLAKSAGDPELALQILETYADRERDGLFPNQLSVLGESSYNTVDASLWFFEAVSRCAPDRETVWLPSQKLIGSMARIIAAYFDGRVPNARLGEDGLLFAGTPATQLTWMDAQVAGRPVTPRHGAPVEINALWYNALRIYRDLHRALDGGSSGRDLSTIDGDRKAERARLASRIDSAIESLEQRFADAFVLPQGYLADLISPEGEPSLAIRPNQLVALSLHHPSVGPAAALRVLDTVEHHLLTPFGLRTLSPSQAGYVGRYEGSQERRDAAYHQGTVWPWLIGPYVDAILRFSAEDTDRVGRTIEVLAPLFRSIRSAPGLYGISEVYDGDPPHRPGGCPAQAWSVAETYRAFAALRSWQAAR